MVKKMKSPRRLIALAIFAIVAMSAFGFAAANTVATSNAGDGTGAVSGGNVTNIDYTVSAGAITGVSFDYSGTAENAQAQLRDAASGGTALATSTSCTTPGTLRDFDCTFGGGIAVAQVYGLRVITWD